MLLKGFLKKHIYILAKHALAQANATTLTVGIEFKIGNVRLSCHCVLKMLLKQKFQFIFKCCVFLFT